MSRQVRWGILGAGGIAKAFAVGVRQSGNGEVVAAACRSQAKAEVFAAEQGVARAYGGYEPLLADAGVEAVYIATPHPLHAEWVLRSAEAGKHVFCEKPAGLNHAEVMAMVEHCRERGVFFMEAFKDRCHPQTAELVGLLADGAIGTVRMIEASFGFGGGDTIDPAGRLYDPALGGGAILDVGCYPVQAVRRIAGACGGAGFADPEEVSGSAHLGATGVDEWAAATLRFPGGIVAQVATAIRATLRNDLVITGSEGRITLPDPWLNSREAPQPGRIVIERRGQARTADVPATMSGFGYEARAAAAAILAGRTECDAMSRDDSLGQAMTLDRWRAAVKLSYPRESPEGFTGPLIGRPARKAQDAAMRYGRVAGLDKDISKLVMGCDNQTTFAHAAVMFDDWWRRGGNAFDTAHLYGGGRQEKLLGQWLRTRGVRDEAVLICKGGHTPWCTPEHIDRQLRESLERLGVDHADLYILHRDNPQVPVGELIDVLHAHAEAGRVTVFGGSNWSLERFEQGRAYAAKHGKRAMAVLSNNFSLARMVRPVWDGCVAASDPASVAFLERTGTANFAWSSQARGYFLAPDAKGMQTPWEADSPFDDEDNRTRRRRAFELAEARGVTAINIAAAYVLCQPFPSFALIGPRRIRETATSLPALDVALTPGELAYLDLRADTPGRPRP